jgi:alpha-amylase/alpha-mannosidase (GH57 family)
MANSFREAREVWDLREKRELRDLRDAREGCEERDVWEGHDWQDQDVPIFLAIHSRRIRLA